MGAPIPEFLALSPGSQAVVIAVVGSVVYVALRLVLRTIRLITGLLGLLPKLPVPKVEEATPRYAPAGNDGLTLPPAPCRHSCQLPLPSAGLPCSAEPTPRKQQQQQQQGVSLKQLQREAAKGKPG